MITEKIALETMKERGYESTSHNESNNEIIAVNFIKHLNDQITIHAKVELKSEKITLSFVELKYFCQLSASGFSFDHKDFEKYEQILSIYAAKCLDIDVFAVLASLKNEGVSDGVTEGVKQDIKTRKRKLWDKIVATGKEKGYAKEMCLEFHSYWTEMNDGGKKMRFEMEKIFDVKRRLQTWLQHDKKWSKTFIDKKVDQQNDTMKVTKTTEKSKLF